MLQGSRLGHSCPCPGEQSPQTEKASPGWRELIRRVYEVDPLTCPACGAGMKVMAFITDYEVIDRIIHHLGVAFTLKRPPPPARQEELY